MRYLFVHQSFPGQYRHILNHLRAEGGHEIVFITSHQQPEMEGVRQVVYRASQPTGQGHPAGWEFDYALRRAEAVAQVAGSLKQLGYRPDVIIGHQGWGEMLNLGDVWPGVPMLGYFEFYYNPTGLDVGFDSEFPPAPDLAAQVRAKNSVNLLTLQLPGLGQTPTRFQKETYPAWAQEKLTLLREGVDLEMCRPDPEIKRREFRLGSLNVLPHEPMVTFISRNMEPYRGFHSFMRALPEIQRRRPDAHIVLAGGNGVGYGAAPADGRSWREVMLRELEGLLDLSRIHFTGWLPHEDLIRMMQRSDAHVYLTYPFVLSWSLREAMAVGCPLVVSDTAPVREMVQPDVTGLVVPFSDPQRLAESVLTLIEDKSLAGRLGRAAHHFAQENLGLPDYLQRFQILINEVAAMAS
ncbi:glycosyltransferase family 4 protein [Oecophyllibacter saccharovorans]|uniref:glycosyltransferase family 4 protein n=1 Tax=Oecophyllibacter saccharovorans TaxID=2558360 RepID=UPI0011733374|nr:glycosyltransferase family 4 protein [Oecophyllibacter saccharovorans]TPW36242.1 glycosyltransferase [Oecophyllibacter saccharovorans]